MSDELNEVIEDHTPLFGLTKTDVTQTVAKAVIATVAAAATTVVLNKLVSVIEARRNKDDDPS